MENKDKITIIQEVVGIQLEEIDPMFLVGVFSNIKLWIDSPNEHAALIDMTKNEGKELYMNSSYPGKNRILNPKYNAEFFYNLDEPNKSKETLESMLAHANNSVDTENPGVPNNAFDALFAAGAEFVDFDVPDRSDEKEEFNRDAALFAIKTIKKLIQKPEWADYLTWAKEPIAKTPQGEICQNETIDAKEKDEAVAVEMVNLFKQSKAAIDAETDEEPAPKFTGLLAN